jgi:hypothetical protein
MHDIGNGHRHRLENVIFQAGSVVRRWPHLPRRHPCRLSLPEGRTGNAARLPPDSQSRPDLLSRYRRAIVPARLGR